MSLGVKGGLSSGGVGTCKIGKGGALVVKASVTPGIVGMRGGKERHSPRAISDAIEAIEYFILLERENERDCVGLMSIFAGNFESLYTRVCLHLAPIEVPSCSSPEPSRQYQHRARKKVSFWVCVIFQIPRGDADLRNGEFHTSTPT